MSASITLDPVSGIFAAMRSHTINVCRCLMLLVAATLRQLLRKYSPPFKHMAAWLARRRSWTWAVAVVGLLQR